MVLLAGWVAGSMPDNPSSPVHAMLTSPWYQKALFGSVVAAPVSVGGVLSMLMWSTVVEFLFPATSCVSPWTCWSAPSLLTVVSGPQPAIPLRPESASEHANVNPTLVLFQPWAFAAGLRLPVIVGGTVSTFTWVVC